MTRIIRAPLSCPEAGSRTGNHRLAVALLAACILGAAGDAVAQDDRPGGSASDQAALEESRRARSTTTTDPREQEIDALLEQIEKTPGDIELHFKLGNTYHALGYLHSALQHFNEASSIDSTAFRVWVNRGVVLRELSRHDEAKLSFEKALELNPDDPLAHVNLGDVLLAENQYQAAVDEYRAALEHDPRCATAFYSLALAFAETGMYRQAGRAWEQCATLVKADRGEDHELYKRARDNAALMGKIVADAQKEVERLERLEKELEEEKKGQSD